MKLKYHCMRLSNSLIELTMWLCAAFVSLSLSLSACACVCVSAWLCGYNAPAPWVGALGDDARLTSVCRVHRA